MSVHVFGQLISRLKNTGSPSERKEILSAVATHHVFTCQQLGIILMNLKYSAEREEVAQLLTSQVVDPENACSHLLPFIACENHTVRQKILQTVVSGR